MESGTVVCAATALRMSSFSAASAPVRPSPLCGGETPGLIALMHRRDRVDLMLFRAPARLGPDAPVAALCGVWSLRAR
jgi:hypothetical protein